MEELALASNCMLVGDKKKFLTLLVTLKCDVDEEANPTDKLTRAALELLQTLGSRYLAFSFIFITFLSLKFLFSVFSQCHNCN